MDETIQLEGVSPDARQKMYNILTEELRQVKEQKEQLAKDKDETEKKLREQKDAEIARLSAKVAAQEKAFQTYVSAGIDASDLEPPEILAPKLGINPAQAVSLLEENHPEFLKLVLNTKKNLERGLKQELARIQVDMSGQAVAEALNTDLKWLKAHREPHLSKPDDMPMFPQMIDDATLQFEKLIEWQKVIARAGNYTEAAYKMVYHYAAKDLTEKNLQPKNGTPELITDYEQKQAAIDEKKKIEDDLALARKENTELIEQIAAREAKLAEMENNAQPQTTEAAVLGDIESATGEGEEAAEEKPHQKIKKKGR